MTRKVLKFAFETEDGMLTLPPLRYFENENPVVLFGRQHGKGHVWVETSDDGLPMVLEFKVFATGQDIVQQEWRHVHSMQDGPWVWDLYMKRKA